MKKRRDEIKYCDISEIAHKEFKRIMKKDKIKNFTIDNITRREVSPYSRTRERIIETFIQIICNNIGDVTGEFIYKITVLEDAKKKELYKSESVYYKYKEEETR